MDLEKNELPRPPFHDATLKTLKTPVAQKAKKENKWRMDARV
jgi:hypothetical protein